MEEDEDMNMTAQVGQLIALTLIIRKPLLFKGFDDVD